MLEHHEADREGRRLGSLFRERELDRMERERLELRARDATRRAHRHAADATRLEKELEIVQGRLGRALDELRQRSEEDERVIDQAGRALEGVAPAVKPCHYAEPCGTCPSCRFTAALAAHRERFPRST